MLPVNDLDALAPAATIGKRADYLVYTLKWASGSRCSVIPRGPTPDPVSPPTRADRSLPQPLRHIRDDVGHDGDGRGVVAMSFGSILSIVSAGV